MPIDTRHKDYDAHIAKVTRARDASAGQDAIHAKGEIYLPRIDGWDDKKYRNFLKRTTYYNASGRTLDGLVGMIMKKDPVIEQTGIDNIIDDVDLHGNKIASVIQMILREVLIASRFGLLVEYPQVTEKPRNQAEQAQKNLRPYVSVYKTESIINWHSERINNVMQPVFIVLEESYIADDSDKYAPKYKTQYRELLLEEGIYKQRVYRQEKDKGDFVLHEELIPKINTKPINFIPFYAFGSDENSLEITDSPILDLVNTNLAHYMVNGDYENGCHVSGLPTLAVSGIQLEDGEKVAVGGAIVSPDPNMQAKYVEVMSKFEALLNNLQEKKKEMATLGARMLEQQKNAVESEGAMQMRAHGENSVLGAIAKLVGDQVANMLLFMSEWAGIKTREINVTLNTDFMPVGMTAQQLTALVTAWQSGSISKETLFYNLKRGEVIADDVDYEDEQERMENQEPILTTE